MALNIIKSVNTTSIIANNHSFCRVIRYSYQSVTRQTHSKLVKRWKLVAEHLDLSEEECRRIVLGNRSAQTMSDHVLTRIATVFKEIQIPPKQLVESPVIFGYSPVVVEQRYFCLKELGLQPVSVPEILRYPTLMKRNAFDLKWMNLLAADVDPLDHLLSQLPSLDLSFLKKHPAIRNMSLLHIRQVVLLEFLSQRLAWKKSEIMELLENYSVLRNRSIYSHRAAVKLLVDTMNISTSKLLQSRYLLTIQPNNVEKLLANFTDLGGQSITSLVEKFPKLLFVPADRIMKTNEYLRQLGITDKQIANCWTIYFLPTATVQERLNEMLTASPCDILVQHPQILSFVCHFNRVKSKFQSQDIASELYEVTRNVQDVCTRKGNISFLSKHFNTTTDWIRVQLTRHPRLSLNATHNCRNIVNYLIEQGFSTLQIENALHIVLYSIDTIQMNLAALPLHKAIEEFGDWKTHPYILQLLLYEMEKRNLSSSFLTSSDSIEWDNDSQKAEFLETNQSNTSQMASEGYNNTSLNYWEIEENSVGQPESESYADVPWD